MILTKELTPRQIANREKKNFQRINIEKNQKPVKEMTLCIEWKKSRMWGNNPSLEAKVLFHDGSFERSEGFKASGCGYDKESTVIAQAFNKYLKYKLWALPLELRQRAASDQKVPYGITSYQVDHPSFEGGIGTSCYYEIAKHVGGKFEHVASGKTFDVYKFTDGKGEV